jgi:NADPH-dependent 2,4-dienoyl-CoA reductase/sulfur reductase-like enzyme/pSer/pThr/pTyr-binding forkhead associated (FHA) protein
MARKRFVIIGDGAAGLAAAERLRYADPSASIGLFTDDPSPGYYRAALTNYLLGELREDQLWAVSPDFYQSLGIRRVFGRVVGVDAQRGVLWDTTSPTPTPFDGLLVASGARPRPPSFDGAHLPGVMTLRTIQDARQVVDHVRLRRLGRAVVLGGGALGLEWAHALSEHGVRVTIMERSARFLPNALDEVASDLLAARLRQAGIEVVLGDAVVAARPGQDGTVSAVLTQQGRKLECGLVAAALGVVASSEFLRDSGIKLAENGAIVADRRLATDVPNVWAAGDVARVEGEQLQLWEPARHQGRIAGDNMSGRGGHYQPGVHYFATRLFDLDFGRLGSIERAPNRQEFVDFPRGTGTIAYRKLVVEGGRLVGALMIGERGARVRTAGRRYKRLIDAKVDVSSIQERLLDPSFDADAWLETQKLFEPPRAARPATQAVAFKAAKLRGTQLVSIDDRSQLPSEAMKLVAAQGAGTSVLGRGTALLRLRGGTELSQVSSAGGTSMLGASTSGTNLVSASVSAAALSAPQATAPPRGTRVLSIGLQAEERRPTPQAAAPIEARLEGMGRVFPITTPTFGIGNSADADIPIAHEAVATLHAQIVRHGDALYLRDSGSRTGTWINDRLLSATHPLTDGDRVRIGPVELVFRSSALKQLVPEESLVTIAVPHLEVRSGQSLGLSFTLRVESLLIGSAPGSHIELRDLSVAPQHARARMVADQAYLTDLGSGRGTFVAFTPLAPGQEVALAEGAWLRIGIVDLVFTRRPMAVPAGALRPRARLRVDTGPGAGSSIDVRERALVGSGPEANLRVPGLAHAHLEVAVQGDRFVARDLSGGATFRSGSMLGSAFVPLTHGDSLLLAGATMLRFEELP